MKRLLVGATVMLAAACNNVEVGLVVEEVPPPTDSCSFSPGQVDFPLTYDSERMSSMFVPTEVTSLLSAEPTRLSSIEPAVDLEFPNSVTPLRFDFRWECDSNGFTAGQGPLILPAFSVDNPFCLDTRDEANSDFAGFDVVSASGTPVSPDETAIWVFTPVTAQLGNALNEAFQLAELSQQCCDAAGGCENVPSAANQQACIDLQEFLNSVAPDQFSIQQPETLDIWRPYVFYTPLGATEQGRTSIPSFPLRLRGVYEGITAAGSLITSTEFIRNIGVCRGEVVGGVRLGACTNDVTIRCLEGL